MLISSQLIGTCTHDREERLIHTICTLPEANSPPCQLLRGRSGGVQSAASAYAETLPAELPVLLAPPLPYRGAATAGGAMPVYRTLIHLRPRHPCLRRCAPSPSPSSPYLPAPRCSVPLPATRPRDRPSSLRRGAPSLCPPPPLGSAIPACTEVLCSCARHPHSAAPSLPAFCLTRVAPRNRVTQPQATSRRWLGPIAAAAVPGALHGRLRP